MPFIGADDRADRHRPRGLQRPRRRLVGQGARRPEPRRGSAPRTGRLLRRARHALRRAGAREAGQLAACCEMESDATPGWSTTPSRRSSRRPSARTWSTSPAGAYIDGIILKATVPSGEARAPGPRTRQGTDPEHAPAVSRARRTGPSSARGSETAVFAFDSAAARATASTGPGIVEMEFSTIVVPPGQQLRIDQHGLGLLQDRTSVEASRRHRSWKERVMSYPTLEEKLAALKVTPAHRATSGAAPDARGAGQPTRSASSAPRTSSTRATRSSCARRARRWAWPATRSSPSSTPQGDLVNASAGTYLHAVIPPIVIKYVLRRHATNPGIADGDIWYTNDALYGGIHNPDQVAIMPVFFERRAGRRGPRRSRTPPRPAPASPAACRCPRRPASRRA